MICYNIGRGLNVVSEAVTKLYEEERIDMESAMELLNACRRGVHCCDGKEGDAIEYVVNKGYCGICMEKSDQLSNIYENTGVPSKYQHSVFDEFDKKAALFFLCPECRKMVLSRFIDRHHFEQYD